MRSRLVAALLALAPGMALADPPARLGVPVGTPEVVVAPTRTYPDAALPAGYPIGEVTTTRPVATLGVPGAGPLPTTTAPLPVLPAGPAPVMVPPLSTPPGGPAPIFTLPGSSPHVPAPALLPPGMSAPARVTPVPYDPYAGRYEPGRMPSSSTHLAPGMQGMGVSPIPALLPPGTDPQTTGLRTRDGRLMHGAGLHATGPCGPSGCGPIGDCFRPGKTYSDNPFGENLSFFAGLDGAKEPVDLGVNARFGYRMHINWGLPIVEDWNLGLHLGVGYNEANNAVRVFRLTGLSDDIQQFFFTVGIFQKTDLGFNWEIAWDFRHDDYYDHITTTQWRGLVSYYVNDRNEIGLWGTYRDQRETVDAAGLFFTVKPINQVNLFFRHMWDNQITTGVWVGIAEEHGRSLALANEPAIQHPFIFGCDVFVPLSDRLAIWGEAQFITPNDSGTVIATLGVAWFPFGRPAAQPRGAFSPLLPTANNTSFSLDAQR